MFNWKSEFKRLEKIDWDDFLFSIRQEELRFNQLVKAYEAGDRSALEEIAAGFQTRVPLEKHTLTRLIGLSIDRTNFANQDKPYRKVHFKEGDRYTPIMQAVHPIVVSKIHFNNLFYHENQAVVKFVSALNHDIGEDLGNKGILDPDDYFRSLWSDLKSLGIDLDTRVDIERVTKSLTRKGMYDEYILGILVETRLNRCSIKRKLREDNLLIPSAEIKNSDNVHNGMFHGEIRTLYEQDPIFDQRGLTNSSRMEAILKSAAFIDPQAQFFDYIMDEQGNLPGQYRPMFRLFYLNHSINKSNLEELWEKTKDQFSGHAFAPWLKDLEQSAEEYFNGKGITEMTPQKHDIQYYIDHGIEPSIFDGTVEVIRNRINRVSDERLYSNPAILYHLLKFATHIKGLEQVYARTFLNVYTNETQINHIENFQDLNLS